jgi:hypothetical protein
MITRRSKLMIMKEELKRDKLISVLEKMIKEYSDLLDVKDFTSSKEGIHFEINIKNVH